MKKVIRGSILIIEAIKSLEIIEPTKQEVDNFKELFRKGSMGIKEAQKMVNEFNKSVTKEMFDKFKHNPELLAEISFYVREIAMENGIPFSLVISNIQNAAGGNTKWN